jgi:hypothetical protein
MSVEPEPRSGPSDPPALNPRNENLKGCLIGVCIIILGSLVFLWFCRQTVTDRGYRSVQAKSWAKGLEIGIKSYKTEYLHLPASSEPLPTEDNSAFDTTEPEGRALLDVLLANSTSQNLRQIHFWEPSSKRSNGAGFSASDGLKDPWGQRGYKILLDYSGDGKIANPANAGRVKGEPDKITSDVIIYSAGPDGDFATWKDNVCSWR